MAIEQCLVGIGLQHKFSLESQKGKNVFDVTSAKISQEDNGEQDENLQPGHRRLVHLAGPGGEFNRVVVLLLLFALTRYILMEVMSLLYIE